jgi:hypothetical protein
MRRARPATRSSSTDGADELADRPGLALWLRARARSGAIGNIIAFTLLAVTAASRAAHDVLSPAGLVAVVLLAAVAATGTGWVAGFYEGAAAGLHDEVGAVTAAPTDRLAGRRPWRIAAAWAGWAGLWAGAGAVLVAAILRERSAPTVVVIVALVALVVPAAIAVDLTARAAGAAAGTALRTRRPTPVPLLRRAWRDLALPLAAAQAFVNAGAAWVLFHGAASDGTLTKGGAFADATLFAALLASLFGALGSRWGSIDVAAGRIVLGPDQAGGRSTPLGPQALVYAGVLAIAATSLAGLVVPATPSLLRVALVRGVIAGALTLVACALGVVRGAVNATPLELGPRPEVLPADQATLGSRRGRLAGAAAVTILIALALAVAPVTGGPRAGASGLDQLGLIAELDAFAVRVEYDIPLPASTGSVPQVVGVARRTGGSEVANGLAAAPTRFDAVVGGTFADPDKERKGDESRLPQAECAFPGPLADVAFAFPTDVRPDTAGVQPIGHATARCGEGPTVELAAVSTSGDDAAGLGPAVSVGGGAADGRGGPVDGVLHSTASARVSDLSILEGLITADSVEAHGASHLDGSPGGATTEASVDITGLSIAGTTFDLRDGDLVVAGSRLPVGGSAAGAVLAEVAAALAPSGCGLSVLDSPASYPQGFLFARPEPELGVADDGHLAASMAAGILVQCDLPQDLTGPTEFSPQRMQVAIGFAFTSVTAQADIGGFGIDDIGGGTPSGGSGDGLAAAPIDLGSPSSGPGGFTTAPGVPAGEVTPPARTPASPGGTTVETVFERVELLAANFAAGRPWVWGTALVLWVLLAHRGLERARREIERAAA